MIALILIISLIAISDVIIIVCCFLKKDNIVADEETWDKQEANINFINQQLKIKS